MNILQAKHGFIFGSGGSGKTFFVRNLIEQELQKCIYITSHNEDYGNTLCITINEPSVELKNIGVSKINEYINQGESFVIKIASSYVGDILATEYLKDVLFEILNCNKNFTLIIDDALRATIGENKNVYEKLLSQKLFSVVSIFQYIYPGTEYVFNYAEVVYLFKISPSDFEGFEQRGLLSKNDFAVLEQKVGEYIIRVINHKLI